MGFLLFPVFIYGISILFYLLAHRMPNRKWLSIYGIFWFTILLLTIFDIVRVTNLTEKDGDLSLGWLLVAAFIFLLCMASIVGVASKAVVLYLTHKGRNVNLGLVHVTSFLAVQFVSPILIGIVTLVISLIIDIFFSN